MVLIQRTSNRRLTFLVFSFFFIVNIASSGGHFDPWDGLETFFITESMVLKHSAMLYPDLPTLQKLSVSHSAYQCSMCDTVKSPRYSFRSLLPAAVAVPFYYAATIFSVPPTTVVALFVNSLLLTLISVVIFCFTLEVYGSRKMAFILSLIFGFCSFAWPFNSDLFPQPLQTLLLITSAFLMYISARANNLTKGVYSAGFGGLFLGLSLFAHPTSIIMIPGFVAYSIFFMRRRGTRTMLISFLAVLGIVLSFMGIVNYWRFGSVAEFGYGQAESLSVHSGWHGLVGLLASPGAGLIFFFPISILLPLAFKFMYRENKGLFFLSAYVIIVSWLYFGTINYSGTFASYVGPFGWSGGGWGSRYLVPVLPFIILASGALIVHLKKLDFNKRLFLKITIVVLCIAGFYVNLLGKLVWYGYDITYAWESQGLWKVLPFPSRSFDLMVWNPTYSPIVVHMKIVHENYVSETQHTQPKFPTTDSGVVGCSYDIYIFCKFGITPILILSAIIAIIAIFIMRDTGLFSPRLFIGRLKDLASTKRYS